MAYKFSLGTRVLSGNLVVSGNISASGGGPDHKGALSAAFGVSGSSLYLKGTGGPYYINDIGNTRVKGMVITSGQSIGAGSDPNMLTLTQADNITVASDVSFVVTAGKLEIGDGNAVNSTAAELNLLDGSSAGTVVNSKAVIYSSDGDIVVGDDLQLTSDSSVISMGAGADATFTHDGTTGLTIAANPISIDATNALDLSSTTGDINFQDGGVNQLALDMDGTGGAVIMKLMVNSDRLVFKQYDGTEVLGIEDDASLKVAGGAGSSGVTITSAGQLTADGRIIIDDATDATSATNGSLQTDGGLSVAKAAYIGTDLIVVNDITLKSDSAVLGFGADTDTTLTHTDGTGLTLNSTNKICFNDTSQFIYGVSNAILGLGATDEIDLTATLVDMNANLDLDGTANISGLTTLQTGLVPDADDGAYLGAAGNAFSDLFLAEGGVINWDSGDATITQASNVVTLAGATFTAQFTNALACDTSESGLDGTDYDGSAGVTDWKLDLNDLGAAAVDVSADSIAIVDANASNATKKESIVDLVSAMAGAGLTATNGVLSTDAAGTPGEIANGQQLSEGWNFLTGTVAGALTVGLPNLSAPTPGDTYHFKVAAGVDGTRTVTVACSGTHKIDNETSVILESPYSAISLVYLKTGSWAVF